MGVKPRSDLLREGRVDVAGADSGARLMWFALGWLLARAARRGSRGRQGLAWLLAKVGHRVQPS